jgi:hypothetical protein
MPHRVVGSGGRVKINNRLLVPARDFEELAAQARRVGVAQGGLDRAVPAIGATAVPKALYQGSHAYI